MNIQEFINDFKSQLENDKIVITPETDYVHSDFWDSLTNMVITVLLDDNYQIQMESEELNSFSSVQDLFDFVKKNKK
ncbi:acyl carrier protein [Chryseobacterium sp. Ch-15]|uniref:Acyl carrier protein n=1 Tax=Chryseobacterium muglaense TaxID=2893752 RepID=A0A9Q3UYR6_9FLAO|nr:acyl carrier protein [Chryseobacterium muglaense]MBD3905451.1 acyl carrier protein [Chryseobacterium muglaense]MCC9036476.1 acyl carrier protein [Chryseobacterium muglaense]MCM2555401.1 acyl carrier protein [Chryseobacterium muglaense]